MSETQHVPVLLKETLGLISKLDGGIVVDATLGFGGHTKAVLEAMPNTKVVALDQDESAIGLAVVRLHDHSERVTIIHASFARIASVLEELGINEVDAVIADLGVSSMQIDSQTRGFSFRYDAPLDMRMDEGAQIETAADILMNRSEKEIADIIYQFGEERASRRIARRIVAERDAGRPIERTLELANLVKSCVKFDKKDALHPATRTFQALRIAVNHELDVLEPFIFEAFELLKPNGVIAIISFHSLEDRIVKQAFQRLSGKCICPPKIPVCVCNAAKRAESMTKKPITASAEEIEQNPRSRSAKLRAIRKISP